MASGRIGQASESIGVQRWWWIQNFETFGRFTFSFFPASRFSRFRKEAVQMILFQGTDHSCPKQSNNVVG